jgi:hypothetical protein
MSCVNPLDAEKADERIPVDVDPPRSDTVAAQEVSVARYIRRRATPDHIDATFIAEVIGLLDNAGMRHTVSITRPREEDR